MYRRFISLAYMLFAASSASAQSFELKGVTFTDSVYLADQELQGEIQPYMDRPLTFADIQEMTARVQALYTRAGIPSGRVLLLPQEVSDGFLKLDLVEADVGKIGYEDLNGTSPEWLSQYISLREGAQPDYAQLERDFRIFQISHDFIPQLSFAPGEDFATINVTVGGEVPEKQSWVASLDNFGTETTGEYRASISGRTRNLAGRRDIASYQLQVSEGALSASAGYSIPFGLPGGRINAALGFTKSDVIQGPFAALDIVSDSVNGSIGYQWPLGVSVDSAWTVDISIGAENATSELDGLPFQDTVISDFSASVSYQKQAAAYSISGTLGAKVGTADAIETSETEGDFQLLFGSLNYTRALFQKAVFETAVQLQYAPDQNLPVNRLIAAGGPTSVRGYTNSIRSGDTGVVARFQVAPLRAYRSKTNSEIGYTPFGFTDVAFVQPFREDGSIDPDQDYLASAGAGVRVDFKDELNFLLMLAVPLKETLGFTETGKGTVYVGLDYEF